MFSVRKIIILTDREFSCEFILGKKRPQKMVACTPLKIFNIPSVHQVILCTRVFAVENCIFHSKWNYMQPLSNLHWKERSLKTLGV